MSVVVIGVCTAQRPKMLAACLDSIAKQQLPKEHEVHLIVVDNEAEPNNERAVAQFASVCRFPAHYVHETRRGIAIARNAALDRAEEVGADWIAFTDDDCRVAPDWLFWLLRAAEWYRCDIVYGLREWLCPKGAEWLVLREGLREGQRMERAATHNVLIASWIWRRQAGGLRFNEQLAFGEDSDFAMRACALRFDEKLAHSSDTDFSIKATGVGAKIRFSNKPVVWEELPPERATFRYQTYLAYRYSMSHSNRYRRQKGWLRASARALTWLVWRGPVAAIKLSVTPAFCLFGVDRFKRRAMKHTRRLVGVAGAVAGVFGLPGDPYRKIVGH